MPRGFCFYPQKTDETKFLDGGDTLNPARCPYRSRWKPYVVKAPTFNLCCQKAYVPIKKRADPLNKWIPATHEGFSDERVPAVHRLYPKPKFVNWKPNSNCSEESICQTGNCQPKMGPTGPRARGCSDKYRCVLKDGGAWRRSSDRPAWKRSCWFPSGSGWRPRRGIVPRSPKGR